jgi:hypothetical protein
MAKRKKQVHVKLYWRTRSDGAPRAWGDFREYAVQGAKREPLVATGPDPGHLGADCGARAVCQAAPGARRGSGE